MLPRNSEGSALVCAALALFATDAGVPSRENAAGFDVLCYVISLEVEAGIDTIVARTDIELRISADGIDRLRFDLVGMTVDSTLVEAESVPFQRGPASLALSLDRERARGDTLNVSIFYHGAPADGLVIRRNLYGRPTVFADNWPNRARFWFPSNDHPSDKAMVGFRVLAPAGWSVVANGRLLEASARDDGRVLTVWRAERPIPVYTMVVGAADMVVRGVGELCAEGRRCVPITQWSFFEDEERAARLFRRAPEIVAFFDSLVGPFPYAKLALVQSTTRYGGMENASAIFFAEGLSEGRRGDGLVAHEIAHQWFGDAVTETEWPHLWLSEGFATYFASVFFEFVDGEQAGTDARAQAERTYMGSASDVERPILDVEPDDPFSLLNANSYQKGAWVLHMLRRLIGDEAFFAGIRDYYAEFVDANALSSDLQRVMERRSGRDLGWFFDQWLERPGYPQVETFVRWDVDGRALDLRIVQSQRWPAFRFPLRISVEGEGFALERSFWVDERESRFSWQMPAKPNGVVVDPENDLLGPTEVVGKDAER